jgi:Fe-S-cluster-containing dehydrogenase component/anaerobic selenocysteine-containing dehydrogenase
MIKYWKSLEERENRGRTAKEAGEHKHKNAILDLLDSNTVGHQASRRDFLKLWGYSLGAAALAASCERPVQKAIPFLFRPEEMTPGMAKYYASTFFDGQEYASILVKTRDGRPIKIEPNDRSGFGARGTTARVQASVLGLYDDSRYKHPLKGNEKISWEEADGEILAALGKIRKKGGKIVLLSSTVISPSTLAVFGQFREKFPGTGLVWYDASSASGMLQANRDSFGKAALPAYHFEKADLIVSFGADFLGTWLSPAEYTAQYVSRRELDPENPSMSKHYQFETGMSVTGSNADVRIRIKPSQERLILAGLYNTLARQTGSTIYAAPASPLPIDELAGELLSHKGSSLVVSGSNDPGVQQIVNEINYLLGNYGETIDFTRTLNTRRGISAEMLNLVDDMNQGGVDALFCINVNPVYDFPLSGRFEEGLGKVGLKVSFACLPDETAERMDYICPDSHYLESWGDAAPGTGFYSLQQPVIQSLFDTRQVQDSLLKWCGKQDDFHAFMRNHWKENLFKRQSMYRNFDDFWNHSLQDGVYEAPERSGRQPSIRHKGMKAVMDATGKSGEPEDIELLVYESVALGTGRDANNPWLMELPDPVTKLTWENAACVSPALAGRMGLNQGDRVSVSGVIELPVLIQPGQADYTVSVAAGYGRTRSGKVATGVGANAVPLRTVQDGELLHFRKKVTLEKTGENVEPALTQEHHTMEGREIVRETSLNEYKENRQAGNELHEHMESQHTTLYEKPLFDGHHWGLAVDLNKCIGCSACAIACQSENNIAVVGRDEVRRRRIMHWIRIDRYYSETPDDPKVYHQPVMCQHCDNAPCENVCPVSATNHSNEGLNQMSYNRCIGTKYCINNCPYRVRRFNWFAYVNNREFDFHQNSALGKMVLNPDVVVRERGVVEKCSFCVQRIQEKKLQAKLEDRKLVDGEIKTACVQACPADALVFGDLNDPESRVSKMFANERNYHLLEELHTLPSVGYLVKVRNTKD